MAVIEQALRTILTSTSPQLASGRVYFSRAPQQVEFPFIVYQRKKTDRLYGPSGDFDYARVAFQVKVYATTASDSKTIANSIRGLLHRYSGTVDGIRIQQCAITDEEDMYEDKADTYVCCMSFVIGHVES